MNVQRDFMNTRFLRKKFMKLLGPQWSHKIKDIYFPIFDAFHYNSKAIMKNNTYLKNRFEGKRCFFLLSGASIEHIDLSALKKEFAVGSNLTHMHKKISSSELKLNMYLTPTSWANATWDKRLRLFKNKKLKIYKNIIYYQDMVDFFSNQDPTKLHYIKSNDSLKNGGFNIIDYRDYEIFTRSLKSGHKEAFYTKGKNTLPLIKNPRSINLDYSKRTICGTGSVFNTLLMLVYMGFKTIYLCGAGYTYSPRYELNFFDNYIFPKTIGNHEALKKSKVVVDIHNKVFDSDIKLCQLFEKGNYYHGQYVSSYVEDNNSLEHRKLQLFASANKTRILNITPDGFESPIYDKISWAEVLNVIDN